MYSQSNEERTIVDYFNGRVGAFLDIGAYDGVKFSNTLRLAELGWTGLAIEPDPFACSALIQNYREYGITRVQILNAAVALEPGIAPFATSFGDGVSTLSEKHQKLWCEIEFADIHVCGVTVEQVLSRFTQPFDFVNLDVEGTNIPILRDLPLAAASLVCIEHEGRCEEVIELCADQGLKRELLRNCENIILAR